jgi:hypothetical protein
MSTSTSYLESIPTDVLEHIAFFVGSASIYSPPCDLVHLLLCSRSVNNTLRTKACPQLYASLFRARFDRCTNGHIDHNGRWRQPPNSLALTTKFISRCGMLQRVRRDDKRRDRLSQDLLTVLEMVLEDKGLNATHLTSVMFPEHLRGLIVNCLSSQQSAGKLQDEPKIRPELLLWLAALTWSRCTSSTFSVRYLKTHTT